MHGFLASHRRLLWRSKRVGAASSDSMSSDRLHALFMLLVEGELTHGQLVRETQLKPASVSALLDRLEASHLVRRRQDEHDGRVWWISLTAKGRAEVARTYELWIRRLDHALLDTTDRDLAATSKLLDRLSVIFDDVDPEQGGA